MQVMLAADGSDCTRRAMEFLVAHPHLSSPNTELLVFHVQPLLPPLVERMVGSATVGDYQREEADKVLLPVRAFLLAQGVRFRCEWVVGNCSEEILSAVRRMQVDMLVMGTRGHGLMERALMGSVAQRVLVDIDIPVLLVK